MNSYLWLIAQPNGLSSVGTVAVTVDFHLHSGTGRRPDWISRHRRTNPSWNQNEKRLIIVVVHKNATFTRDQWRHRLNFYCFSVYKTGVLYVRPTGRVSRFSVPVVNIRWATLTWKFFYSEKCNTGPAAIRNSAACNEHSNGGIRKIIKMARND